MKAARISGARFLWMAGRILHTNPLKAKHGWATRSVGFNEGTWLDFWGHPHTNLLHIVERITRPSKQTMHYEATIDDPGAYTKPWTVLWDVPWRSSLELKEYICQESNHWLTNLKDDFGRPY